MTIDHIGVVLYPEYIVLRIIGRLSFPIYCYLLVLGNENTRNVRNYFIRLFLFALISQAPYCLAFGYTPFNVEEHTLNIFFTLSIGIMTLHNPLLLLISAFASIFLNFDYGFYGFVLIAFTSILKENKEYGTVSLILLSILSLLIWKIQIFSLFALPIILLHRMGYLEVYRTGEGDINGNAVYSSRRKYFYYAYYPLHLIVLYLIKSSFF